MIKASGVTKHFQSPAGRLDVLRGIDLSISKGEMAAVMGASGVGKSTLLHILGTLDFPSSGMIVIDGREIQSLGESETAYFRNQTIGFVFQFHHLLPEFTARENVMMPAIIGKGMTYLEAGKRADSLLGELGVEDRMHHRPGELSGGQQQRVAVARALIMNPKVVLADEPTGNLDTKTGDELFDLLVRLNKEMDITFVIVTHNESLAGRCTRIIEMKDGLIKDARPLDRAVQ